MREKKAATSIDVAKLAGVSQSTVSRVFNQYSEQVVSDKVKNKVIKVAKEIGYKPNFIARSMISGVTNIVGVVLGFGVGPFYNQIILNIISKIQSMGKQPLFFKVDERESVYKILTRVLQHQVDAIIITSPAISQKTADECFQNETPVILFNRTASKLNTHSVYCDGVEGGVLAANYLYKKGHRDFVFVGNFNDNNVTAARKKGFFETLKKYNVKSIVEKESEYTYDGGYNVAKNIISSKKLPTAIFCTSDLIAIGIMEALKKESNIKIPKDISIIGYDNISMSDWKSFNLTTIKQPIEKLMDNMCEILTTVTNNKKYPPIILKVSPELVERGSVTEIKT